MSEFHLGAFLPYRINRLAERASDSLSRVYRERFAINVAQWRILAILQETPDLAAKAVVQATNLDKVQVSRAVADLEQRGLLLRRVCDRDARSARLRLSDQGEQLFARIAPLALAWEADYLQGLTQRERTTLFRLLDKLDPEPAETDATSSGPALEAVCP